MREEARHSGAQRLGCTNPAGITEGDAGMLDQLELLLCEVGSFVTFLGPKLPGVVHTTPANQSATKLAKLTDGDGSCVVECFGKWTGYRRRQYDGANYEEAIAKAADDYEAGMFYVDTSGSHAVQESDGDIDSDLDGSIM